jgi:hypothetical protein
MGEWWRSDTGPVLASGGDSMAKSRAGLGQGRHEGTSVSGVPIGIGPIDLFTAPIHRVQFT